MTETATTQNYYIRRIIHIADAGAAKTHCGLLVILGIDTEFDQVTCPECAARQ